MPLIGRRRTFVFAATSNEHGARQQPAARSDLLGIGAMFAIACGEYRRRNENTRRLGGATFAFASIRGEHRCASKMFNWFDALVQ
ncbi:hypothetical protein RA307_29265 [Xanthobacteraceae bacterium Astr-EGSB]|uniref:hypothetical protein n=1 Tax=Astrobacterium formosum TaxID=3069710 RepID=UPI0027B71AF2|nr:hypothetical protein [Xanthobacteraceae bacterium Astr-EGSB]